MLMVVVSVEINLWFLTVNGDFFLRKLTAVKKTTAVKKNDSCQN